MNGTHANNPIFNIATNAAAGPVLRAFIASPGVFAEGRFSSTQLFYDPASAGANTELSLRFNAIMTLFRGASIRLFLPGFTSEAAAFITSGTWNITVNTSSSPDGVVLTMTASERVPGNVSAIVVVPVEAGVYLPVLGLSPNQLDMTISCDAVLPLNPKP